MLLESDAGIEKKKQQQCRIRAWFFYFVRSSRIPGLSETTPSGSKWEILPNYSEGTKSSHIWTCEWNCLGTDVVCSFTLHKASSQANNHLWTHPTGNLALFVNSRDLNGDFGVFDMFPPSFTLSDMQIISEIFHCLSSKGITLWFSTNQHFPLWDDFYLNEFSTVL